MGKKSASYASDDGVHKPVSYPSNETVDWSKPANAGEQHYEERASDLSSKDKLYSLPFTYVFNYEWQAIEKRREALGIAALASYNDLSMLETKSAYDVSEDVPHLGLKGLALSGGGIRSAAFCIGVTQAMDAVLVGNGDDEDGEVRSFYQHMDYVSSVSGGGYAGAALLNAQKLEENASGGINEARFAFPSRLARNESAMLRHIRDHSNYLFPEGGFFEKLRVLASYLRGIAANIPVVVIVLALALMLTTLTNDQLSDLKESFFDFSKIPVSETSSWASRIVNMLGNLQPGGGFFGLSMLLALMVPVLFLVWSIARSFLSRPKFETDTGGTRLASYLIFILLVVFAVELQPRMISGLYSNHCKHLVERGIYVDADEVDGVYTDFVAASCGRIDFAWEDVLKARTKLATEKAKNGDADKEEAAKPDLDKSAFATIVDWIQTLTVYIAAFTGFFAALRGVFGSSEGHQNQTQGLAGVFANFSSMLSQLIAGLLLPLGLWIGYLYLAFWSIPGNTFKGSQTAFAHAPDWYAAIMMSMRNWFEPVIGKAEWLPQFLSILKPGILAGSIFFTIALVAGIVALFLRPNSNSPHNLYRDSLAKAFIKQPMNGNGAPANPDGHQIRLSDTRQNPQTPIHLFNAALNVQGSDNVNGRGRNASFFTFSDAYCGSVETGYVATKDLETVEKGKFTLSSAMAISAAAASSAMGSMTMRPLAATFALLNVRLGYWLPNPRQIAECIFNAKHNSGRVSEGETSRPEHDVDVGSLYIVNRFFNNSLVVFFKELFGFMEEKRQLVYLSDGGHIENLGVYELLKRRCKFIVVVDAEADPQLTFSSFAAVQRYARIDLGTLIDVSTEKIREATMATKANWHPPVTKAAAARASGTPLGQPSWEELKNRPHAAIGTIHYPDDKLGNPQIGVMLYIKLSVTGDENDYVQEYARKYRKFPHETTGDQFFSEEQFEAYRALGFHAMFKTLLGAQGVQHWGDVVSLSDNFYGTPDAVWRFQEMFPHLHKR
ncbi:MAG: hypothetical protein QNJ29_08695 [Rhizobiaceae bacterium]|nr:hypothetical protein [Rhizobiaceae bacterium]